MTRLDKLLEVCNAVREAGGGDPIEALLPSVPQDEKQCLIARNLNFHCRVTTADFGHLFGGKDRWVMIAPRPILEKVATALNGEAVLAFENRCDKRRKWMVELPKWMGKLAADFDHAFDGNGKTSFFPYLTKRRLKDRRASVRGDLEWGGWSPEKKRSLRALEAKLTQAIEAQS